MTIRGCTLSAAAPVDVPDLLRLIKALAEYERLSHLVAADVPALEDALFGERPAVEAMIVRQDDQNRSAIAFALFFTNFSTFLGRRGLWLEDLFVMPEHRGRGIGKWLLTSLVATARARGCGRVEWSVLDWNAPAIGFYERLGATVLPEWRIARVTGAALADFGVASGPAPD